MDDFLLRALLAGLMIALIAGPLGVFILWRRMAYFGDTLSHSAILGVALGLLLSINLKIGILLSTVIVAGILIYSQSNSLKHKKLASDTLLGIISHSALSLGLVLISFVEGVRIDIESWLFGDILTVSWNDLAFITTGVVIVIAVLLMIWKSLLSLTVHEELALVEGVNVSLISAIYTLLIAVLVAIAMKIVGALLITALLIIPAASARQFSRTPEQMALISIGIGMLAVVLGLSASFLSDTPAGPSIVVSATILFLMSQIFKRHNL